MGFELDQRINSEIQGGMFIQTFHAHLHIYRMQLPSPFDQGARCSLPEKSRSEKAPKKGSMS